MNKHVAAVSKIASRVKEFYAAQKQFRIYHGSTNSTRQSPYRRDNIVDTSGLTNILRIDKTTKTALVEPNVPMDKLVDATLQHNLLPPVVMEFPGITVGGGWAGTGGESSSFKYSFFDQTVKSVEMVLATGEVVTASQAERPDLFHGAASSFGTLGITTLVELQLRDAEQYVSLSYRPVSSMSEAVTEIKEAISSKDTSSVDFVDGIMFSKNSGVICVGRLSSEVDKNRKTQRLSRRGDPWFYLRAQQQLLNNSGPSEDLIPIKDYLFRYDRGAFWMGRYAYEYFKFPFNWISRWILDPIMHTRTLYHAMHKSGLAKSYIIQDVAIPFEGADEFLEYLDKEFGQYPIWLCPLLQTETSHFSPQAIDAKAEQFQNTVLNFGVWGLGPQNPQASIQINRELERKVRSLGGKKWLYSNTYYTEDEFWSMYDLEAYKALRTKYHASHLPSVYDKVKARFDGSYNTGGYSLKERLQSLYAVAHTLLGSDYLMQKEPSTSSQKINEK